jgi:Tol biopolymer transport system component
MTAQQITTDAAVDFVPVWSPDGTQLAFESNRGEWFFNIFRYVFDRAEERRVTRFRLGNASQPDWQRSRVAEVAVSARISVSRSTLRLI